MARRIQMDIKRFYVDTPEGLFIELDEEDIRHLHVLIIGPKGTPYEDGFFYFDYIVTDSYPFYPPKVTLKTTGNGSVRFNPNLYKDGMVCLSILGTYSGPIWSPSLSLVQVLLSIQSLMSENPYYNEPGREGLDKKFQSDSYNIKTQFHTLKHAVGDIVERKTVLPPKLYEIAKDYFLKNIDNYINICSRNIQHDNKQCNDGYFGIVTVNFNVEKERLLKIMNSLKQ